MVLFALSDPISMWTLAATLVVALATVMSCLFTGVYVYLTHRILRTQTDPCVIVYTELTARDQGPLLSIVLENVGNGLAKDTRCERNPDLTPTEDWEAFLCEPTNDLLRKTALVAGIPALPPGGKRVISWGPAMLFRTPEWKDWQIAVVCKCRTVDGRDLPHMPCVLETASLDRAIPPK
jgi:hypothetical protein